MEFEELQDKHPKLVAKAENLGVEKEKLRVGALMKMKKDPAFAKLPEVQLRIDTSIEKGEDLNTCQMACMAIMTTGLVTVPIYETNSPEQILYIINHCEARIFFIEDTTYLERIMDRMDDAPGLEQKLCSELQLALVSPEAANEYAIHGNCCADAGENIVRVDSDLDSIQSIVSEACRWGSCWCTRFAFYFLGERRNR